MGHSMRQAGPETHIRIIVAALIAVSAVLGISRSARLPATLADGPTPLLIVKAEPVQVSRYGAVIR